MSRRITAIAWFAVVALLAAACGGGGGNTTGATGGTGGGASGSISVMAVWTGAEQAAFKAVIDGFTAEHVLELRLLRQGSAVPPAAG